MRLLFTIIITTALLGKSFFFLGWELWYKLDQTRIAKEKCENKDKPAMKCNGKCYLAKQLKKLEAEELKNASNKKHNPYTGKIELQSCTILQIEPSIFTPFISEHKTHLFNYASFYSKEYLSTIFHPPTPRFS
jgi:hypothetical protein